MKQTNKRHKQFWNKEYKKPTHLALSTEPADDLEKFTRWIGRRQGHGALHQNTRVLDLGCGNGRNLVYLAKEFGARGVGYDISAEAIKQAKELGKGLPVEFTVRQLNEPIPLPDGSVGLVLDMMSSHVLESAERVMLRDEIWRVLKPGGYLFFKSFLLEDDDHAKRLLREHPAGEQHSYIHPELGIYEHVWTTDEIDEFFGLHFEIKKVEKSHKHRSRGRAFRRRTVTVYLEKRP